MSSIFSTHAAEATGLPIFLSCGKKGETAYFYDTNRLWQIVTSATGGADAVARVINQPNPTAEESSGRAITMADNGNLTPFDTSGGNVVLTIADNALDAGFEMQLGKTSGSNNLSFDPDTNVKINGTADTQVDKTNSNKLYILKAIKDNELLLIEI